MSDIDGNATILIQKKSGVTKNAISEQVPAWEDALTIEEGFLDLMGGTSGYTTYNAKIQESTHVFICDYVPLPQDLKEENARAIIGGKVYDVTYIDNPMGLDEHLEIFLKYTGGQ